MIIKFQAKEFVWSMKFWLIHLEINMMKRKWKIYLDFKIKVVSVKIA